MLILNLIIMFGLTMSLIVCTFYLLQFSILVSIQLTSIRDKSLKVNTISIVVLSISKWFPIWTYIKIECILFCTWIRRSNTFERKYRIFYIVTLWICLQKNLSQTIQDIWYSVKQFSRVTRSSITNSRKKPGDILWGI